MSKITLSHNMFFCAPRRVLTDRLFCIISWSNPVMATAMKMPAKTCLNQKLAAFGSGLKTVAKPESRTACRLCCQGMLSPCNR